MKYFRTFQLLLGGALILTTVTHLAKGELLWGSFDALLAVLNIHGGLQK
jgi:hypothetical protein